MNAKEKAGCKRILKSLDQETLFSLCDTVTKKLITVATRSEAVSAILTYSESVYELLKRKKLKRDFLFKYAAENGIVVSVNADKRTLIEQLLQTWGTNHIQDLMKDYDSECSQSSSQTDVNTSTVAQATPDSEPIPETPDSEPIPETQQLGETFTRWFYRVLNSHNPHMGLNPEEFGTCHFWDEARLQLMILSPDTNTRDELHGSELVSERLLSFTKNEGLLFNPNISRDGIFTITERHGLIVVLVCGTIHRQNQHLGVFDQMFGLVKDPRFNDNYKIKISKLKLQNIDVSNVPSLRDRPESEIKDLVAV